MINQKRSVMAAALLLVMQGAQAVDPMPAVPADVMNYPSEDAANIEETGGGMRFKLANADEQGIPTDGPLLDLPKIPEPLPATSPTPRRVSILDTVPETGGVEEVKVEKTSLDLNKPVEVVRASLNALEIEVEPGINEVVPISVGHYNRIVTPFEMPAINTVSEAEISVHQNVIYVATGEKFPVTLFVTPSAEDETSAISLTLNPQPIPPVEVTLKFGKGFKNRAINTVSQKWEQSTAYEKSIRDTLARIALQDLPPGYGMSDTKDGGFLPTCQQEGLKFEFINGQYLKGHHFEIAIGTVSNISGRGIEIDESNCIDPYIVAVAPWPLTYLEPNSITELYVMMRPDLKPVSQNIRPTLLPTTQVNGQHIPVTKVLPKAKSDEQGAK